MGNPELREQRFRPDRSNLDFVNWQTAGGDIASRRTPFRPDTIDEEGQQALCVSDGAIDNPKPARSDELAEIFRASCREDRVGFDRDHVETAPQIISGIIAVIETNIEDQLV